jgi:hypothetical protein
MHSGIVLPYSFNCLGTLNSANLLLVGNPRRQFPGARSSIPNQSIDRLWPGKNPADRLAVESCPYFVTVKKIGKIGEFLLCSPALNHPAHSPAKLRHKSLIHDYVLSIIAAGNRSNENDLAIRLCAA